MADSVLVIEPNLRTPSGHYADFVRAVGMRSASGVDVYAHPAADAMLAAMDGVSVCRREPRVGAPLAEWRTIFRAVAEEAPFLVLTADGRHAAAVSLAARKTGLAPRNASFFFHRPPTTWRDRLLEPLGAVAREHSLAITSTEVVAASLRASGWQRVVMVPYPTRAPEPPTAGEPFCHLLMAGAARLNKGLDLVAGLAAIYAREGRTLPLLVQVSKKHAGRHGRRESAVVDALLGAGYGGLKTDDTAPDRAEYLARFRGALVLAPYAREQFASQVSGVVLDALLNGAPVITTSGTWPAQMVERFNAGIAIDDRTPAALAAAVDMVLNDWHRFAANACAAASVLAGEHDPLHLVELLKGER